MTKHFCQSVFIVILKTNQFEQIDEMSHRDITMTDFIFKIEHHRADHPFRFAVFFGEII